MSLLRDLVDPILGFLNDAGEEAGPFSTGDSIGGKGRFFLVKFGFAIWAVLASGQTPADAWSVPRPFDDWE